MNTYTDNDHIRRCLEIIEKRWQRGPSGEWKTYDFEKLSDAIFDATGVSLSISTLKRLFGKVNYANLPSIHTLNTLANFAGFEDWNAFKRRGAPSPEPGTNGVVGPAAMTGNIQDRKSRVTTAGKKLLWWPILILPLGALAYLFLSYAKISGRVPVNPSAYSFTCNKVLTEGVPNSVVFHYDAQAAPSDSVFIVQTWDMSRRAVVSKIGHDHSAIYYYPGYFVAKLVVDTQIVRTHDLMIGSGGWLALAEGEPTPFYFKKPDYLQKEGEVVIDSALLARHHLPLYPEAPVIRLFYMRDMGPLSDDNFTFETTLRSDRNSGAEACQQVEVLIQCKNDIFIIPLCAPACIGDLQLYAAGKRVTSKEADLSGFGADLRQWTTLKMETAGKHIRFTVNDKPAYSLDFPDAPTDIVGVQYRFRGGGAVKDTRFTGNGRMIDLK
jgi:hypothetical protein